MADYIFYRTFDVGRCTILDKMDDNVGGLESMCVCILNIHVMYILIGLWCCDNLSSFIFVFFHCLYS